MDTVLRGQQGMRRVRTHVWLIFAGLSFGACAHLGAERMYPVRVICHGCPPAIRLDTDIASVQRKMPGTDLEIAHVTGWAWSELDLVDPAVGGAPRAQRDALKLLAALLQHTDSKPEQQRLMCRPTHGDAEVETTADAKNEHKRHRKALEKEKKSDLKKHA